jgi:lysine 2,3-aminomutase
VTSQCPIFCRFCTRKRKVGDAGSVSTATIQAGIEQIKKDQTIRDIVISGGDPLVMQDEQLEWILKELRAIPHVEILRIGSRVPAVLPQRITPKLCEMLKKYHPLYINVHFNHPREITPESSQACQMLADAGIPLGNQCVLLKGVNDDPEVMKELMQGLLKIRVRPYYIYQADLTNGTGYFRTSIQNGMEIMQSLRGHTSGLAVPHYVIDAPGGGGKIPIFPETIVSMDNERVILRNYEGKLFEYPTFPSSVIPAEKSCANL